MHLELAPCVLPLAPLEIRQRLALALALQATTAFYQYSVQRRCKPGLVQLLASGPALLALLVMPFFFHITSDEVVIRTVYVFTCSWLATFKVVASCMNRGPLVQQALTLVQFITLLYLPVYPLSPVEVAAAQASGKKTGRMHDVSSGPGRLFINACLKIATLGLVVWAAVSLEMPGLIRNYVYALGLLGFLGLLMDAPASLFTGWLGLSIIPTFDAPWLSTSLADFWGRRWNITTSTVLRTTIYDPIVEGVLVKPSVGAGTAAAPATPGKAARVPRWRQMAGVCGTFIASGLAHEAIIWQMNPGGARPWKGKWAAFFFLQAPLLVCELHLRKWWKAAGLHPPGIAVSRVLTTLTLLVLANPLFFGPVEADSDLAMRVIEAVQAGFRGVAAGAVALGTSLRVNGLSTGEL